MIIGVDPGKRGAVAFLHEDGTLFKLIYAPNPWHFAEALKTHSVTHAYVEKAQYMPGNGGVGMFTYATGYGEILGTLGALVIPYTLVSPIRWTKKMHSGIKGATAKKRSLIAAKRLFPQESFLATAKSHVPHDGAIDAALIGYYGMKHS